MKKALTVLILIVFFISATAIAQDYRLYPPPVKPVYEKSKASQDVWVYDVQVVGTSKGYVFTANVKALFYAGLDDNGNRIPYIFSNRGDAPQDDPSDFELIDEVFTGTAYIKVGLDNNIVSRTKFKVTGGRGDEKKAGEKDGIIEFKPIPINTWMLTTMYSIVVEINPKSQRKIMKYIWVDKEKSARVGAAGGDQGDKPVESNVKIVREDPRQALAISVDAFLLVRKNERGRLETFKEGAIQFYENALHQAKNLKIYEKDLKELKEKIKNQKSIMERERLELTYFDLLARIQKYKHWEQDSVNKKLQTELTKARTIEKDFKLAVYTYDRLAKISIVNLLDKIYGFYTEVYYTSFGCSPNWTSKKTTKLRELNKKFKISNYLKKGTPGVKVEKGDWKSDKWLNNLEKNWMVQIEEIKTDFRKIFGNAMTDKKSNTSDPNYFGMTKDGTRKFWEPVFKSGYEELYKFLFKDIMLEKTIKSLANLLTKEHSNVRDPKFPFIKEGTLKAFPSPSAAYAYTKQLSDIKKKICKLIYSCRIPSEIPQWMVKKKPDKKDKKKNEWVCPKCQCKSAHKPPEGKCPVCGTLMKEVPKSSNTDETGPGESGR
ncbi:MAG: hypothetical protein K8S87_05830 [Planctomycetes bacterium]|nr:hypothetical protein [Planctomycetota bacterium]